MRVSSQVAWYLFVLSGWQAKLLCMEILTPWCIVYSGLHMVQGPVLNICVNRSVSGETGAEPKGIALFCLSSSVYCSP